MNIRIKSLLSVAVLAAASLPVASLANESQALDQCVQAFVKEVVPAGHPVEVRDADIRASMKVLNGRRSQVDLVARGEKYGKQFGRASCVINRADGSLVAMYLHGSSRLRMAGQSRPKIVVRNG